MALTWNNENEWKREFVASKESKKDIESKGFRSHV